MTTSKTIFLLNIGDFQPEVTKLTYPFIRCYAEKIGAKIRIIRERKFPEYPITYEKFQIYELAKSIGSEWNIYIDSDALLHPQFLDVTAHVNKDTVVGYGIDIADIRWTMDEYFLRDGRHIGCGNWFMCASNLCLDVWHPLDIPLEEALNNIHPVPDEVAKGVTREHLIDDYTTSRNVARFGLKFTTVRDIWKRNGLENTLVQHRYTANPFNQAGAHMKLISEWGVENYLERWK